MPGDSKRRELPEHQRLSKRRTGHGGCAMKPAGDFAGGIQTGDRPTLATEDPRALRVRSVARRSAEHDRGGGIGIKRRSCDRAELAETVDQVAAPEILIEPALDEAIVTLDRRGQTARLDLDLAGEILDGVADVEKVLLEPASEIQDLDAIIAGLEDRLVEDLVGACATAGSSPRRRAACRKCFVDEPVAVLVDRDRAFVDCLAGCGRLRRRSDACRTCP